MTQRWIFYVDLNACFAQLEQQANPLWRGVPIGVVRKPQEFSVISATSYEAKRRGVQTATTTWEAWSKIPNMVMVAEDPAKYTYWSGRYWRMLKTFSPDVEVASVDEAYVDVTQLVHQKYDGIPDLLAMDIKKALRNLVGEWPTCSIGAANSKVLAKIAGGTMKPDGFVSIYEDEIDWWRERLYVTDVPGINKGWEHRLRGFRIHKMIDCDDTELIKLRKRYGLPGFYTGLLLQGKDSFPLKPEGHHDLRKGYGHGRVLHKPYPDYKAMLRWLKMICHEAAIRLRAADVCGKTVHFFAGAIDGSSMSRQYTIPIPTDCEQKIFEVCEHIADTYGNRKQNQYSGIGVWVTKLFKKSDLTTPLFESDRKDLTILKTMDLINAEWGHLTCYPGWLHDAKDVTWMFKANQAMYKDIDDQLDDEDPIDWEDVWYELYG